MTAWISIQLIIIFAQIVTLTSYGKIGYLESLCSNIITIEKKSNGIALCLLTGYRSQAWNARRVRRAVGSGRVPTLHSIGGSVLYSYGMPKIWKINLPCC